MSSGCQTCLPSSLSCQSQPFVKVLPLNTLLSNRWFHGFKIRNPTSKRNSEIAANAQNQIFNVKIIPLIAVKTEHIFWLLVITTLFLFIIAQCFEQAWVILVRLDCFIFMLIIHVLHRICFINKLVTIILIIPQKSSTFNKTSTEGSCSICFGKKLIGMIDFWRKKKDFLLSNNSSQRWNEKIILEKVSKRGIMYSSEFRYLAMSDNNTSLCKLKTLPK